MKFTRRPDLDTQTRIEIVMQAWLYQGVYGKMTHIAQSYQISRTFLYQLLSTANLTLHMLFGDLQPQGEQPGLDVEQLALLLRLEGICSIASIGDIVRALGYRPNSSGYLSTLFQSYGQALPSTLSTASTTRVFYLSDEMFASHKPILVTVEPKSTAILKIELASDRSAETWKAHFDDLRDHHFIPRGMASDRGRGLVAGYQSAVEDAQWVCDQFHELQDLFDVLAQMERKAYAAIAKEEAAAQKFYRAKSEATLHKRLAQYDTAHHACEQAIALYDQLALLLDLLRDALHLCSANGKLRTPQGVRSELTLLWHMIADLDCAAITQKLQPIRDHLDDMLVPFEHAQVIQTQLLAAVPQPALEFLLAAWHHEHLTYQSKAKQKRYHQRKRLEWLEVAEGLLGEDWEALKTLVFEALDMVVRASSLVEMVNSLIRPYMNTYKGQITQEALNLIMFYHNHRRYKSGKRKGQAPLEILTGKPLPGQWYELVIQQVNKQAGGQANDALYPKAPLHLVVNNEEGALPPATSLDQVTSDNTAGSDTLLEAPQVKAA
jgi:hypothetical protein